MRLLNAILTSCAAVACASPSQRAVRPPVVENVAPQPAPSPAPAEPTIATAGATRCTARESVLLGPHGAGRAVLAFDRRGGLAAWKRDHTTLAVQALALDGTTRGAPAAIEIAEDVEPAAIYALGSSYVVLVRRWDWMHDDIAWWGVVVDTSGRIASPLIEVGLADVDITDARVLDEHRIALVVGPTTISKNQHQLARQQTFTVDATSIRSTASALEPGTHHVAVHAPDALAFDITNAAVPPPHGPGGRIIEAMGRPTLNRARGGQRIGEPLELEWNGNPIAHSMNVETYIVWSGTHFIYPFWADDGGPRHDTYAMRLLPIDCRP